MLAAFRESELPFEMYYTQLLDRNDRSAGTARTRPSIAQWVIPALQVLREAAKENIEPDLSYLIVDSVELEEFYEKYRAKVAHDEAVKAAKIQQFNAEKATMRQRAFTETVEQKGQQTSAAPVEETDVTNGDPDETEVKEATANIATEEPTVEASAQESSQQ